jgi:hypothetical protein
MKKLLELINRAETIYNSKAGPEFKFNTIFNLHTKDISPEMKRLGIEFRWCTPDTTYEEDTAAFMSALQEIKKDVEAVVEQSRVSDTKEKENE